MAEDCGAQKVDRLITSLTDRIFLMALRPVICCIGHYLSFCHWTALDANYLIG